ncbi:16S rRNA (guanine(527)-N(7))-methyltransferase RsmG [Mobilicoccus massiliensis]|uniref:16S rRNA (guanine(527)-N(7))-methyltransferase RsmG n=1 Tax=Mobilicoccus massiliensis TaxID=1522310 RepID=UPI0009E1A6A1|nr:16S rRNA (guanine(527)-N(7))-methyltransferase RsmG [Mobilicoccus massiliensis]
MSDAHGNPDAHDKATGAASQDAAPAVCGPPQDETPLPPPAPAAERVFADRLPLAVRYAELLADTGVSHGLIGPREVERLWERHILNCAVVGDLVPEGAEVVDVGSGAGLPGLAIAIARPDVTMHLVEPMARRTEWLEVAVSELGLTGVQIHRGRAEEVDVTGDVVTARAVSKLANLARWMAPLAREGALMLALKGSSAPDEVDRDRRIATRAGWTDLEVVTVGEGIVDPATTVVRAIRAAERRTTRRSTHSRRR